MIIGKSIVITGGSNGIGFALAKILSQQNKVFNLDVAGQRSESNASFLHCDVSNYFQVHAVLHPIDRIDVLINNAGIVKRGRLFDVREKDFDEIFQTNFKGAWNVTKAALPKLSDSTVVLQISSDLVFSTKSDPAAYILSKKAVSNFSEMLKLSYPELDVKTSFLGPVDTQLFYSGREGETERLKQIAQPAKVVAEKLVEFLESENERMLFDNLSKEYYFE